MNKNNNSGTRMRLRRVAYYIAAQIAIPAGMMMDTAARDFFNPALLELGTSGQAPVDLSAFSEKGGQVPGTYRVDIFLNNARMETRNVEFRMMKGVRGESILLPCLSVDDLAGYGVLTSKFPGLVTTDISCANLNAVPQANSDFQFNKQQLLLSFPQSALSNAARGWVDPKEWDDGIPAALLNYSINASNNWAKSGYGADSSSQYVNLRPGINFGPWRLRNYTTWNRSSSQGENSQSQSKWDTIYTYVQRDIKSLKSQLTLGDSSTPSDIFDSVAFRGAQLASDDEMMPESLRGYAPIVRGIARTNAQVVVRQNGYTIYETYVSPGSFEITDMYPTGGSGDLYVTIKESDGSEQQLVVPYASLPVLQREGRLKYSLTSAVYRAYDNSIEQTPFTQGTAIYGLPFGLTFYGGGQFSSKYQSLAVGSGKNLGPLGAVSVDMTQAWSRMQNEERQNGRSFRVRYSKNFIDTGTNFSIAGYRYATDGYWNMQEVLETYRDGNVFPFQERRRNRAELTVNQQLWKQAGGLALTAIREDYWNTDRKMESYGASYNNSTQGISYSLNYTYNKNSSTTSQTGGGSGKIYDTDQLFSVSVSVPLTKIFGSHPVYASYMMNTSKNGNTSNNINLSGTVLEDNNLSWGIQQGYGSQGQGYSGGVNTDWRAAYGEVNAGYSYDQNSLRVNYGAQGSIIAYEEGITLGQPMGETVAIVSAPGATGVSVQGQTGVKTDWRGRAIVPYTSPYRKNDITLNTESFADDTEVNITSQTVVPTRGAVVKASYEARVGHRVLMNLKKANGKTVPFGATVSLQGQSMKNTQSFIVGDGGQVYLTGLSDSGILIVRWGSDEDAQCQVSYNVPNGQSGITNMNGLCQ